MVRPEPPARRKTIDHSSTRGFCICCGVPWPCPTVRRELLSLPPSRPPERWVRERRD